MRSTILIFLILFSVTVAEWIEQANFSFYRNGIPPPRVQLRASLFSPVWGAINQKLDHFNPNDQRTWQMRYIYNNEFWRTGGPIFIMLGAETEIDSGWLQSGQMYDMAQQHSGYMFYAEHRYYGKSYATSDLSSTNLKYLSVDLALADYAYFIKYMKTNIPQLANSKVIVYGGSYGGNIAIWLRQKYPDLVHAAISSSAPVLAKVDFSEYHGVVQTVLGPSCSSVIQRGVDQIRQYLQTSTGAAKVQKDFNTCKPVSSNDALDYWYFFFQLANIFAMKVQNADSNTANEICSVLQDTSIGSEYDRLAKYTQTTYCKTDYRSYVAYFQQTGLNIGNSRQWIYQTCTEFGYFQSSSAESALYRSTIPVDFYHWQCSDIFGSEFTKQRTHDGVARTNSIYGGYNPQVTRVITIQGTLDPWHSIGLKSSPNSDAPVVTVQGTSHCADFYSISSSDLPQMRQAKQLVKDWISYWLSQN